MPYVSELFQRREQIGLIYSLMARTFIFRQNRGMFTGIVQVTGEVLVAVDARGVKTVRIARPKAWKLVKGQSVSIDGICSTVAKLDAKAFEVAYMPETISKTTAGDFGRGARLNLERSLTLADYVDGHFVMGHVDARGKVVAVEKAKGAHVVTISAPSELLPLLALHGSVAVNGVSLTIARRGKGTFSVALIPYTLAETNLGDLVRGSAVNIEADPLARYVRAMLEKRSRMPENAKKKRRKK